VGKEPVKREIRIVGWDDAPFRFTDDSTAMVGVVFRGGDWLDGILVTRIKVDGDDSTEKISAAVNSSPHKGQLRIIMLNGITFGGFNIIDMGALARDTGIPVIAVVRKRPDLTAIKKALVRFPDSERRWEVMKGAGKLNFIEVENPKTGNIKKIWFQNRGIEADEARKILRLSSTRSFVPEPLRAAHIIAHGIGGLR
jgi:endonuclease V-like protein UPF0215 family